MSIYKLYFQKVFSAEISYYFNATREYCVDSVLRVLILYDYWGEVRFLTFSLLCCVCSGFVCAVEDFSVWMLLGLAFLVSGESLCH